VDGDDLKPRKKYSEIFEELCPFYMSIGMSYEQYWDGESDIPKYVRKEYKLRQEALNYEAWLKGLYVYDAVISAMSHMSDNKNNHKNYAEKPYDFTPRKEEENVEEAQAQAEVWLKSWVAATQKMFNKE
jgi:hypothetical protein